MTRPASRLDALTGARFVAAFHVFMYHAWAARGLPRPVQAIEMAGHTAVAFFFVLSGFILAATYGTRGRFDVRDFAFARFARIYPLYALCLVLSAGFQLAETRQAPDPATGLAWAESFLLVQNWLPPSPHMINGVAWTLSVEAFFYLAFPFLLAATARWKAPAIGAALVAVGVAYAASRGLGLPLANVAIGRLPEFLLGILFGRLHLLGVLGGRGTRAAAVFYVAFGLTLLVPQFFPLNSERFGGLMPPLFGALILALANTDALPARLLRARGMVFLGGASYALYLFHGIVLAKTNDAFEAFHRSRVHDGVAFALVASVASVAVASALFVAVEEPSRAWLRRRLMSRRAPEPAALASEPL